MRLIPLGVILLHLCVALVVVILPNTAKTRPTATEPPWPTQFEGHNLIRLELTAQERLFGRDFPGHIARFTDGSREIIIRWVQRPTRRLHPAADCLKGVGYEVTPRPIRRDHEGRQWGCFDATRQHKRLRVCERIGDGQQRSWSDVSSWYWAAMLQRTEGPWWAITVAEPHV